MLNDKYKVFNCRLVYNQDKPYKTYVYRCKTHCLFYLAETCEQLKDKEGLITAKKTIITLFGLLLGSITYLLLYIILKGGN